MGAEPGTYPAEFSGVHPVVRATEPVDEIPVTPVPVTLLRTADSPRLAGLDAEHVHALAATDSVLPPILVHRPTMRVIDGRHRLRAAVLRGQETVEARLVDGHEDDLFALSVRLNVTHGLPLSTADRAAAVRRLLGSHPQWSDRAIGHITGLSAKSVASIRRRASGDAAQLPGRVGRDGRTRPLNAAQGRLLASRLIRERPAASLREIAREAAISIGTAHDVRRRLTSGQHPVPAGLRRRQATARIAPPPPAHRSAPHDAGAREDAGAEAPGRPENGAGPGELLRKLRRDPSLRFSEAGRGLLRLMETHAVPSAAWQRLAEAVPPHCAELVAAAARECAASWLAFAQRVERAERAERAERRGEPRGPRRRPGGH